MYTYRQNQLFIEDTPAIDIAQQYGTPCYVYSYDILKQKFLAYQQALQGTNHLIAYSVKANSNIALLNLLAKLGSGFDIVSGGELARVIAAGGSPNKILFSGVGKSCSEIEHALDAGIACFNVESESELIRIDQIAAKKNCQAPVSLRVNPNIDAKTHPYISTGLKENKFGIDIDLAKLLYSRPFKNIQFIGIDCHIGSQLVDIQPTLDTIHCILELVDTLKNNDIHLSHIDIGGGLGVSYKNEKPPSIKQYVTAILNAFASHQHLHIYLEPGRSIIADAGILITKIEYIKNNTERNFAIVDAAMNDLARPSLYQAWMNIQALINNNNVEKKKYDVAGPVCESADFLGKDRELAICEGDYLAIMNAGAYSFCMSSNYNSRPRACEVIVHKNQHYPIRQRESLEQLFMGESLVDLLINEPTITKTQQNSQP